MVEVYPVHGSDWAVQHYSDLLRASKAARPLWLRRSEGKKPNRLIQLASLWLDEWITNQEAQIRDNPDVLLPYFWSGPMGSYAAYRYRWFV